MKIDEMKPFILEKLKAYSSIPSLTKSEHLMLAYLKDDFSSDKGKPNVTSWTEVFRNELPYYSLLECAGAPNYLFCVHTDRVPNRSNTQVAYTNTIVEYSEDEVQGQLDDIIGIAILRYVFSLGIPINVLFTTREEWGDSWHQLLHAIGRMRSNPIPISIDIDVFQSSTYESQGKALTLRTHANGEFHHSTVAQLKKTATKYKVSFTGDQYGHAMVEPGWLSQQTSGTWTGAHIGIPLVNYHTDKERVFWSVVYDVARLVSFFTKSNLHSQSP